jgi:hypothetical protein
VKTTPRSPLAPTNDVPASRVDNHADDRGPFHRVVCACGHASPEITDPVVAEYAKALHDMSHVDEMEAAS